MNKKSIYLLIGIGAFCLMFINSFTYVLSLLLKDVFIIIDINPNNNFWMNQLISLLVFILFFKLIFYLFEEHKFFKEDNYLKVFIVFLILYAVSQLLEFLYGVFMSEFMLQNHQEGFSNYYETKKTNYLREIYSSFSYHLRYGFLAIYIFYKIHFTNTKSTPHQS